VNRLDLRGLSVPEPMQRALRAVDALEPGQALEVLTALPPMPLLQALDERGLRWRTELLADGGAWVAILRPAA
jgi:TusA-related sulfurtransferase